MSFEAVSNIAQAEAQAKVTVAEAESKAKQMLADADTAGKLAMPPAQKPRRSSRSSAARSARRQGLRPRAFPVSWKIRKQRCAPEPKGGWSRQQLLLWKG